MNKYRIESSEGVIMGIYSGNTEKEAIRAMNADAGETDLDRDDGLVVRKLDVVYLVCDTCGDSQKCDTFDDAMTAAKKMGAKMGSSLSESDYIWEDSDGGDTIDCGSEVRIYRNNI